MAFRSPEVMVSSVAMSVPKGDSASMRVDYRVVKRLVASSDVTIPSADNRSALAGETPAVCT